MSEDKKSFIMYAEYYQYFSMLQTDTEKADLIMAILSYENDKEVKPLGGMTLAFFAVIKNNLDRNQKDWQEKKLKRSNAGKQGMDSRWHNDNTTDGEEPDAKPKKQGITPDSKDNNVINAITSDNVDKGVIDGITDITVNDNANENVPVNDNALGNVMENAQARTVAQQPSLPGLPVYQHRKKRFIKPTLQQVQEYCLSRHNKIDPQHWLDHYISNGWMIGPRTPMDDWQAAVRTWEYNNFSLSKSPPKFQGMDGDRQQHDKAGEIMQNIMNRSAGGLQQ